jgi:hypothetical protein
MYTVYGRMYGDFPAINTVYTTYIRMYVWFWPTLVRVSVMNTRGLKHSMRVYITLSLTDKTCYADLHAYTHRHIDTYKNRLA